MRRFVGIGSALVLVSILGAGLAGAADKAMSIKQIMKRLNGGPKSLNGMLRQELRADDPAWDDIQDQTKEFAELAEALCKTTPKRGAAESWAKFTETYAKNAKALNEAAQSKDRRAARAAQAKLGGSCMSCHRVHKGRSA